MGRLAFVSALSCSTPRPPIGVSPSSPAVVTSLAVSWQWDAAAMEEGAGLQLAVWTVIAVLLPVLITLWCSVRRAGRRSVTRAGKHAWQETDLFARPTYCSVCGLHILQGGYCLCCGLCADHPCVWKASRRFPCKDVLGRSEEGRGHHWTRGNLPLCSLCTVCGLQCGGQPKLCDYRRVYDLVLYTSSTAGRGLHNNLPVWGSAQNLR